MRPANLWIGGGIVLGMLLFAAAVHAEDPEPAVDKEPAVGAEPAPPPAADDEEPGECVPACRSGHYCRRGKCITLCNPPCRENERCTEEGDCEPVVLQGPPTRFEYFALILAARPGVSESAKTTADIRLEIGGKYIALQFGPGFGDDLFMLRAAMTGHVPYQPVPGVPVYLVPSVALGYAFHSIDTIEEIRQHDLFVTPSLRIRYDPWPRVAVFVTVISPEISFVRLQSTNDTEVDRVSVVPVHWNFGLGIAYLY